MQVSFFFVHYFSRNSVVDVITLLLTIQFRLAYQPVPDPGLARDNWRPGHPDPVIRGRGGGTPRAPPLDPPLPATLYKISALCVTQRDDRKFKQRRRRRQRQRKQLQMSKTTTLHVHYAFMYISLPSLHDCDVKIPNFVFCFCFRFFPELRYSLLEINSRRICQHLTN